MQPQVERGTWYRADTETAGVYCFPADLMSRSEVEEWAGAGDVEQIEGFGARMSAPGYLDCTEWCVFETEREAWVYLRDTYADHDEDLWLECDTAAHTAGGAL